jgi:hypothetical protein
MNTVLFVGVCGFVAGKPTIMLKKLGQKVTLQGIEPGSLL